MTREEAIEILEGLAVPIHAEPAFDMAIEALKAQDVPDTNVGDMISRQLMRDLGATCIARRGEDGKLIALGRIDMLPSAQPVVKDTNVPNNDDIISRQAAIDRAVTIPMFGRDVKMVAVSEIKNLPSAQPEIIRCKDCEFGEQDEVGRWFCRSLGCQIGNEDGSGFCADAERRTDD